MGPISLDTARALIQDGYVAGDTLVAIDDGPFVPLPQVAELVRALTSAVPPAPAIVEDLAAVSMIRLLYRLHRERATGLVVVKDAEWRKDLYLREGAPIYLSSTVPSERFGQFLVLRKRIDAADLQVALESMKSDNNRLGETLVRLGLLEATELFDELREHQRERLIELCCWQHGRVEYFRDRAFPGDEPLLTITVPELLLTVVREMAGPMLGPRLEGLLALVPRRRAEVDLDAFPFSDGEARARDAIDGKTCCRDLLAKFGGDAALHHDSLRVLFLLSEVGALELPAAM